jgi:hypothetical protein
MLLKNHDDVMMILMNAMMILMMRPKKYVKKGRENNTFPERFCLRCCCSYSLTMIHSSGQTRSSSNMSIVPSGFQCTAHPIFFDYLPPCVEIKVIEDDSYTAAQTEENADKNKSTSLNTHTNKHPQHPHLQPNTLSSNSNIVEHCSICLSRHTTPVTLVSCCHSFCRDCALVWFRKKTSCPLCKRSAKYFVQSSVSSTQTDKPTRDTSSSSSSSDSSLIKIWAIYEDINELKNLAPITRSVAAPAIRKHMDRFVKYSHDNNMVTDDVVGKKCGKRKNDCELQALVLKRQTVETGMAHKDSDGHSEISGEVKDEALRNSPLISPRTDKGPDATLFITPSCPSVTHTEGVVLTACAGCDATDDGCGSSINSRDDTRCRGMTSTQRITTIDQSIAEALLQLERLDQ